MRSTGEVALLLAELVEARKIEEGKERAERLARSGKAILRCEDSLIDDDAIDEAIEALHEAMMLGSAEATYTLGCLMLEDASTEGDFDAALMLLEKAAVSELRAAQELLGKILLAGERTAAAGEAWLRRSQAN